MKAADIKVVVPMEKLLRFYGREIQAPNKNFQCLHPENHTNRDSHFSSSIFNDRLTCHSRGCFKNADIFEVVGTMEGLQSFQDQKAKIEEMFGLDESEANQKKRIVAIYGYVNAEGQLLFQTVRYDPKDFKQRQPDGNDGWVWNLNGIESVLYRLPEVIGATTILIVEGEKDVETAYGLGLPEGWAATCNPMGANKWEPQYSEALRNKKVVICPDRDEPGKRHGERIARQLQGVAKAVRWLDLPSGKDLSEWPDQGRTVTQFQDLILHAPEFQVTKNDETDLGFHLTSMSDLLNEPEEATEWLVENLLPSGGLSVIGGKPKAGKSTTVRNLCLSVARGEPFLGLATTKGPVIYCAFEEKRGEVKKHFRQLGALPEDQIFSFIGRAPEDFLEKIHPLLSTIEPKLIILDTLVKVAHISDMNDYSKVMKALDPFLHMARESGAHLLLVHHAGKSDRNGGDNLLGSTAIFGTVDTCLIQKRSDKYRTIESINRYGLDLEETVLEWNEDTKAISLGESKKDTEVERLSKEITAFLETQEEPVLRELIEANVEGGTGPQRKALKKLVDTGRVERIGKGTRGNPFLFSCLVVPSIYREQENKKAKNDQTPHEQRADSCSQSSMDFEGSRESREQEKEGVLGEKNGVFEEVDL